MTCDFCHDLRHFRCRGCDCSVCAEWRRGTSKKVRPKKPKVVVTKPIATPPKKKSKTTTPQPKRQTGPTPWALTEEERRLVHSLWLQKNGVTKIQAMTGFSMSRVKSEVRRIRRGFGVPV